MTIRKLWLLLLILVAVFSVIINAAVLSVLTNRYFNDYLTENYENHFNQIIEYSKQALKTEDLSIAQMKIEMETHLDDPIIRIKLYDEEGTIIVDVGNDTSALPMMMGGRMMPMMESGYTVADQESDSYEITDGGKTVGYLSITRYSSISDSVNTQRFKASLVLNSLISTVIVIILAVIIGVFISKRMSRDLMSTAKLAQDISLGTDTDATKTNIEEIRIIRQSLTALKNRLKLKNKSRKVLVDELIHQTRTPLTILKTHLEGYSDKVIEMTPEEVKVLENQIEDITSIISNMSNIIDVEKDAEVLNIEEFELTRLLQQIVNGLKVQFSNKKIDLTLTFEEKYTLKTDRNKLSQAIYNVLTNAYKFTRENDSVAIDCKVVNENVRIEIKDTGIGMDEDETSRIFDAYYKGNSLKDGDGLGLFIAKENLNKINSTITVVSETGKGSAFTIIVSNLH
ncbi:MAG: HAMP domain-containing histidine kinase [Clostridiales bacterium]|nr:HAMP domain-containing histidine kinase [Clostridiales bacterium]